MRVGQFIGSLFLVGTLVSIGGGTALAQNDQASTFALQPGGSAVIEFEAFCAEFGEQFPAGGLQAPNGVAPDDVRAVLAYAQQQRLTDDEQQMLQVQYAIWRLQGETQAPQGDQLTQDVLAQANNALPAPQGTSVLDALNAGQVEVNVDSWQPVGSEVQVTAAVMDNVFGRGQLTVRNVSQQQLELYMPVGTIFAATDQQFQDMVGYATDIQVNNPQPENLPTTSTGAADSLPLLVVVGLGVAVGGYLLRWSTRLR